jgi:hypothetical protein
VHGYIKINGSTEASFDTTTDYEWQTFSTTISISSSSSISVDVKCDASYDEYGHVGNIKIFRQNSMTNVSV